MNQVPTLAKYMTADTFRSAMLQERNGMSATTGVIEDRVCGSSVELTLTDSMEIDIAATLWFSASARACSYRKSCEFLKGYPELAGKICRQALSYRGLHDELPREFRSAPLAFDMVMDYGAYRDLHRHRRCFQYAKPVNFRHGYEVPDLMIAAGVADEYIGVMERTGLEGIPPEARPYLVPFGARGRFLFKMDFAEADYICRLRSGVKGHMSYRWIAWQMREELGRKTELGATVEATPFWIEEPLTR